ncbi:MAG: delta-60 repeat domain-containing protein [Ignavibacteriales bacterium]
MLRSSNSIPPRIPKELTIMVERYTRAIKKTVSFRPSFPLLGALAMSLLFSLFLFLGVACDTQAAPGDLDPSFGTGGKVLSLGCSNCPNNLNGANAVAIQPDVKIVAAGFSSTLEPGFALVRYNSDGSLDTTFDNSGKVFTQMSGLPGNDVAKAVAIQADGKIVAAGYSGPSNMVAVVYALARYVDIGNTPSPNNNGGGCSIVRSVDTETGVANLLILLIPALAISLKMLRRRNKDI